MTNETTEYLTTDEVCGKLAAAGVDVGEIGKVWAARLQPQKLDNLDKKYPLVARGPDRQVYLIIFRFGRPIGPEEDHWTPRWLSVEGPFPAATEADRLALGDKAKELTTDG